MPLAATSLPLPPTWWGIAALLLHIAGGLLALHALMREHSPQGTLGWMIALILAPAIAIPFYLALAAARIHRRRGHRLPQASVERLLAGSTAWTLPARGLEIPLSRLSGQRPCGGNSVQLLRGGQENYRMLTDALRQAQSSILLEFFIIKNDRVGEGLRQLLEERAAAGVGVYVIYDEIGSYKLPPGYLGSLKRAGVHVASFNGRRYWWSSLLRLNYRNHRKLVVIDGQLALIGSLNIGIEYMHLCSAPHWRDTFESLRGPIVAHAQLGFADDWQRATHEDISPRLQAAAAPGDAGGQVCQLLPSGPDDGALNTWRATLLELIDSARQRLWLASPYLVPDEAVTTALCRAALRGVDVRLIVPQRGDSRLAGLAMLTYLPGLMSAGVRVLAYTHGFLHEKVTLVDERYCTIGTANLDSRSLALNFELTLLMRGSAMARQVAALLQEDMRASEPLTADSWQRAPLPRRLAAQLCRLLAPVL